MSVGRAWLHLSTLRHMILILLMGVACVDGDLGLAVVVVWWWWGKDEGDRSASQVGFLLNEILNCEGAI